MNRIARYHAAVAVAAERRARLLASAEAAKARVAPARLKQDVKDSIGHAGGNAGESIKARVQQRPIATGAAGVALVAWFARRPLMALSRRLYVRLMNRKPETQDG